MRPITNITSHYAVIRAENVDTDQIIPARFLKGTDKLGFGALAFYDWRYNTDGVADPNFVLNSSHARDAQILVAGHNFGCGSSREHAPWALLGAGIRAIISSGFADIFRNNALKNGLLPVQVEPQVLSVLIEQWDRTRTGPQPRTAPLSIDVASQTLTIDANTRVTFPIDPFAKHCLLAGVDQLGFLLEAAGEITAYEERVQRPRPATSTASHEVASFSGRGR